MNSWLVGLLDSWVAWVVIKWTQNTAQLKKDVGFSFGNFDQDILHHSTLLN